MTTNLTHPSPCVHLEDEKYFVMLESPYAGNVELHTEYARACMHDSLLRGEAPFASHLLYTQEGVLDDNKPDERMLGMKAGMEVAKRCDKTVVYVDYGISNGMWYGILSAQKENRPIIFRSLSGKKFDIDAKDIFFADKDALEMGLDALHDKIREEDV